MYVFTLFLKPVSAERWIETTYALNLNTHSAFLNQSPPKGGLKRKSIVCETAVKNSLKPVSAERWIETMACGQANVKSPASLNQSPPKGGLKQDFQPACKFIAGLNQSPPKGGLKQISPELIDSFFDELNQSPPKGGLKPKSHCTYPYSGFFNEKIRSNAFFT